MKDLYSQEYMHTLLFLLEDAIKNLKVWSAYHNDDFIEEIEEMESRYKRVSNLIKQFYMEGGEKE